MQVRCEKYKDKESTTLYPYLTHPFILLDLLRRVRNLLIMIHHHGSRSETHSICRGSFILNMIRHLECDIGLDDEVFRKRPLVGEFTTVHETAGAITCLPAADGLTGRYDRTGIVAAEDSVGRAYQVEMFPVCGVLGGD